jgi:hypothetical protein
MTAEELQGGYWWIELNARSFLLSIRPSASTPASG